MELLEFEEMKNSNRDDYKGVSRHYASFSCPLVISQSLYFAMLSTVFAGLFVLSMSNILGHGRQISQLQRALRPGEFSVDDSAFALNVSQCPG